MLCCIYFITSQNGCVVFVTQPISVFVPLEVVVRLLGILTCCFFTCMSYAASELSIARVVSLSPHVTEMLFAMGAAKDLVGVTNQCDFPSQATKIPKVGNITQPSFEQIVALRPRLVVASDLTPLALRDALKNAGVVVEISQPKRVLDIAVEFRKFGKILSVVPAAEREAVAIENAVLAFEQRGVVRKQQRRSRSVFLAQVDPPIAAAPATWIGDVLATGGFENVVESNFPLWPRLSREFLISQKIDYVFLDAGKDAALQATKFWEKAAHKPRVVVLPPNVLVRPGPRVVEGLRFLSELQ